MTAVANAHAKQEEDVIVQEARETAMLAAEVERKALAHELTALDAGDVGAVPAGGSLPEDAPYHLGLVRDHHQREARHRAAILAAQALTAAARDGRTLRPG